MVASPSFIALAREQRASRAALEISGIFRLARSRALARGHAVVVRWDAAASRLDVREPALSSPPAAPALPASCAAAAGGPVIAVFLAGAVPYEMTTAELLDEGGAARAAAEVCYLPGGRALLRYDAGGAFAPQAGVPQVLIANTGSGRRRAVLLAPSGAARVAL